MVLYKKTNVTAKNGINFVRSAVEGAGSLFHKIEGENDLGIDGLIELIRDERPLNRQVAVQIKSGPSYYNSSGEECLIPIESHRDYWLNLSPSSLGCCLCSCTWRCSLGKYQELPERTTRPIPSFASAPVDANRFDQICFHQRFLFRTYFVKYRISSLPEAFTHSLSSPKPDESYLGLIVLFRRYPNVLEVWTRLIQHLS
jgi:hypothetical protein